MIGRPPQCIQDFLENFEKRFEKFVTLKPVLCTAEHTIPKSKVNGTLTENLVYIIKLERVVILYGPASIDRTVHAFEQY